MTTMRFRKGTKVEVLSKKIVPTGSWHCAQIISGNGHNYTVRYDGGLDAPREMIAERVSRKAIRPCPPSFEASNDWVFGDVVEVYSDFCWKMATVSKIVGKDYILVRLLGSSLELKVHRSNIRVRQSWEDEKWIVIGKGSGPCAEERCENLMLKSSKHLKSQVQDTRKRPRHLVKPGHVPFVDKVNYHESLNASSKTMKRGSFSQIEGCGGFVLKFRAVGRDGKWCPKAAEDLPLCEDGVAFQGDTSEKHVLASFTNRTTGLSQVDAERTGQSGTLRCSLPKNLIDLDDDTLTCSVGSCSGNSENLYAVLHHVGDFDSQCSDAESICQLRDEQGNFLPTKEEMAAEVRRLELQAYHRTMEALHALGPLTWEQEALMTNLRLSLHISNDEHLMELRNLISNGLKWMAWTSNFQYQRLFSDRMQETGTLTVMDDLMTGWMLTRF